MEEAGVGSMVVGLHIQVLDHMPVGVAEGSIRPGLGELLQMVITVSP